MLRAISGILVGALSAVLSLVAYSGPLDQPIIGLIMASGLVASGAWFVYRIADRLGWLCYGLTLVIVTGVMLITPLSDDILYTDHSWALEAWLVLLAVSSVLPALFDRGRREEGCQTSTAEIEK
ncbi:hypothetical protein [Arcanobacterium buesumense]|uniref:Uncharacterized protein n=1 Tax=Arcanobacterium buesumense TaxID=2722751 RepID=A0A6H2EMQ4_9ACTO|nr:hypothetical protein [Arcanobacterium buesumense]QJC22353.1 hypothetical protein HC352_07405 [Arcanobacterium buesumense]